MSSAKGVDEISSLQARGGFSTLSTMTQLKWGALGCLLFALCGCGEGETAEKAIDLSGREWLGTYVGTQPTYNMLNAKGEPMVLYGTPVVVSSTQHQIQLRPDGAKIEVTSAEGAATYRYDGAYVSEQQDINGFVGLTIRYKDEEAGNEQEYALQQVSEGHFEVSWGGFGAPKFMVHAPDAIPLSLDDAEAPLQQTSPADPSKPMAKIQEGRSNVNVRMSPPSGRVVRKVDGGVVFEIHEERAMSDAVYLLKQAAHLATLDGSKTFEKAANAKLNVMGEEGADFIVELSEKRGTSLQVRVPKSQVIVSEDAWYRSDDLGGWVYSGLCERLDQAASRKDNIPAAVLTVDGVYRHSDADFDMEVIVTGSNWASKMFLASGEVMANQGVEFGVVRGSVLLDESGYFEVGLIEGGTLRMQVGSSVVTLTKS